MRTVDDFAEIRRLHRDGVSARQIARRLRVGRDTIRKALADPEPKPYTLAAPRPAPVFGAFQAAVDAILDADRTAPRKQRHTATQVYRRLVAEHGYAGSYDPIRRHLKDRRLDRRETFIPLEHPPGHRLEADFGHIYADFPDGRRQVPVLVVTWSYSNAPFALALPTERTEAILHGLVEAFARRGTWERVQRALAARVRVAGRQNLAAKVKWLARAAYRGWTTRSRPRPTWMATVAGLSHHTSFGTPAKKANASPMPCNTASVRSVGRARANGAFE